MHVDLEELDYRPTPIGELVLRRRREPALGIDLFEVKLGDEYLAERGAAFAGTRAS